MLLKILFIFILISRLTYSSEYDDNFDSYNSEPIIELENLDGFPSFQPSELLYDGLKSGSNNQSESNILKPLDDGVSKLLSIIPNDNLKHGLETYRKIISAEEFINDRELGETNKGISLHFAKMLDNNSCFSNIANEFYADISALDKKYRKEDYENIPGVVKDERANLSMQSGDKKHKELKPGWMMKLAKHYAGGDPNIAMRLIAMCGHDDINQGDYHYKKNIRLTDKESKDDYLKAIDQYKLEQVSYLERTLKSLSDFETFKYSYQGKGEPSKDHHQRAIAETRVKLDKYKEDLDKFKTNLSKGKISLSQKKKLLCPEQNSVFYLAKSLSSDVDIDKDFLEKLVSIQAPKYGAKALPSKSYHFYMSAYMSCRLIEEGIHPFLAKQIQKMAAWSYRTIRMNSILARHTKQYDFATDLEKNYLGYVNKPIVTARGPRFPKHRKNPGRKAILTSFINEYRQKCGKDDLFEHYTEDEKLFFLKPNVINKYNKKRICANKKDPIMGAGFLPYKQVELSNHLDKLMDKWDAAVILDNETLGGGSVFDKFDIPHTNLNMFIESNLVERPLTRADFLPRYYIFPARIDNPKNWPIPRLEKAAKKAATYMMDWEWTVKQHEIGAKYGAKNCKPYKIAENFDSRACKLYTPQEHGCNKGIADDATFDESIVEGIDHIINKFKDWN